MSETRWTKEQQQAISEKNCNLLVAAAAGAGKTAVLVERIIQKIIDERDPVDIDSLLVVTFTNAAATEMRERIGAAISKTMEGNRENKNIQKQLALLNKASITTIHSFCLEVIRSNFQELEIDPNFRILDETEAALLKIETLNELFEEIYEDEQKNPDFFDLLEAYGSNRDDQNIQDMVQSIYSFIQSYPWPEQWLKQQVECYNPGEEKDFAMTIWGRILLENAYVHVKGLIRQIEAALTKLDFSSGLQNYQSVFANDYQKLCLFSELMDTALSEKAGKDENIWNGIVDYISSFDFETLPRCGKDTDKKVQEEVKGTRDEIKTYIRKIKDEVFFMTSGDISADMKTMYPILRCIGGLVLEFSSRYAARKVQRSALDFNDLEHYCLKILSEYDENGNIIPSKAAKVYKEKFSEILVDEYQDSNLVQEIIIKMISREDLGTPNVFMVGDVKQSIYRFRQAKPELFLEKYRTYSFEPGSSYRKILLFKNFRSRKEVVDGVNFIFKQIMSRGVGELDYTKEEELNPGAEYSEIASDVMTSGGAVELHLMETSDTPSESTEQEENSDNSEGPEEDDEILDNIQKEARMVAGRIVELMKPDENGRRFAVFDRRLNAYRNVEFRDMVILFRTTKNWTDIFTEELAALGIPTFADTGSGFFKTPEIQVVLSLLQIIDNPYQDIPLLSVLRSQIGNFDSEDLAELRLADRKSALFDALKALGAGGTTAAKKADHFLSRLKNWRNISVYMSTHKLIWQLYNDTGYYSIVGALSDGEKKQANLRMLFERSLQFESTSYKGLFNFINFIDKLKTSKGDLGSAKVLGENDNVVRLMSIHKSKGLEFPVVFLSGCGKKFNFQDMYKSILIHQELGFGPDFVDFKKRIKYPSIAKQSIAQKVKVETLSEEMRILYVALTRAREKLILTGAVSSLQKSAVKWLNTARTQEPKLSEYEMLKVQNYLGWLCPAILRHRDAETLRSAAGPIAALEESCMVDDKSNWRIYLHDQKYIAAVKRIEQGEAGENISLEWLDSLQNPDLQLYTEVDRRLGWNYPHAHLKNMPSKISVTELKRFFNINEEADDLEVHKKAGIKKPVFLQERKGLSSAEKGTLMHFVMQHIDFSQNNFEAQIISMVQKELITEQQAESINVQRIRRFVLSDLGQRLIKAGNYQREVPFNVELSLKELFADHDELSSSDEKILVQGVIDCYFQEDGHIILLDYKTDYVREGESGTLKEKYGLQLSYYARALELLTSLKVTEKYIYLFSTEEIIAL